ncbi:MAG: sugar transferase, partial [Candidatus Symbiothrix sp.]|nr:sugar transferase [Candidatus Symbiothrix sp.]
MRKRSQLYKYLLSDFLTSAIAWLLFNAIRYDLLAQYQFSSLASYLMSDDVLRGQLLVPFGWLILHYYSGYYNNSLEKSRLAELFTTLQTAFIGSLVIFFVVVLKRLPKSFHIYYELVGSLFALSFVCMYLGRLMITLLAIRKTHKKEWTIHAVILGNGEKAQNTLKELNRPSNAPGYSIQGFINTDTICPNQTAVQLPVIGELKDLEQIIKEQRIEELIIAVDTNHDATFLALLYSLYQYKLPIKLPVSYSKLLTGGINLKTITSFPLIDVTANNFSDAEKNIKLSLDKLISLLVLLLLSPLYLYLMIRVKMDSTGSVFIRQERIGKGG